MKMDGYIVLEHDKPYVGKHNQDLPYFNIYHSEKDATFVSHLINVTYHISTTVRKVSLDIEH
jgi:hypothetical protein